MKNTNAQSFSKQLPKQDVVFLFCLPCWGKRRKEEKKKRKKKKEKRKRKKKKEKRKKKKKKQRTIKLPSRIFLMKA